ncbi:pilin [Acidovorax sp. LjRoot118]
MSEAFQTDGITGLTAAATAYAAVSSSQKQSKYVDDVVIATASPWNITVAVAATAGNGIPTGLNGKVLNFSPNVQKLTPSSTAQGAIDWACTSTTDATATARGLGNKVLDAANGLPAKYAPSECR